MTVGSRNALPMCLASKIVVHQSEPPHCTELSSNLVARLRYRFNSVKSNSRLMPWSSAIKCCRIDCPPIETYYNIQSKQGKGVFHIYYGAAQFYDLHAI